MSNLQAVKTKTKTKQALKTDEIQDQLLEVVHFLQTLNEEQVNFILAQYLKNKALESQKPKKKKQNTLPPHIREGIRESLEEIEWGEYTTLRTNQEIDEYLESLLV